MSAVKNKVEICEKNVADYIIADQIIGDRNYGGIRQIPPHFDRHNVYQ